MHSCWVAEGLEGGKVALVTMLHHAYVDGVGAKRNNAAFLMVTFRHHRSSLG
ncbi:MAG: wax ester/triacylglycerol synthase domain-containing protein [Pseudomonadales bacterium]